MKVALDRNMIAITLFLSNLSAKYPLKGGTITLGIICRNITNCNFTGDVTNARAGGLFGGDFISNGEGDITIQNCDITGNIMGTNAGGIAGEYAFINCDISASISNCNFISNDIGLVLMDQSHATLKNSNFIDNETYGLGLITEEPILEVSYSNFWDNSEGDCMENCPG